jgi:hypothetical protein
MSDKDEQKAAQLPAFLSRLNDKTINPFFLQQAFSNSSKLLAQRELQNSENI